MCMQCAWACAAKVQLRRLATAPAGDYQEESGYHSARPGAGDGLTGPRRTWHSAHMSTRVVAGLGVLVRVLALPHRAQVHLLDGSHHALLLRRQLRLRRRQLGAKPLDSVECALRRRRPRADSDPLDWEVGRCGVRQRLQPSQGRGCGGGDERGAERWSGSGMRVGVGVGGVGVAWRVETSHSYASTSRGPGRLNMASPSTNATRPLQEASSCGHHGSAFIRANSLLVGRRAGLV